MIDTQYFKINKLPLIFFNKHSSRQQKWCKREQGQAYLNHAERSPFSRSKNNEISFMMVIFFLGKNNLSHIKLLSLFAVVPCKAKVDNKFDRHILQSRKLCIFAEY